MTFETIRHTHDAFYDAFRAARTLGLITLGLQVLMLSDAPCVRAVATAGDDELLLSLDVEALDARAVRHLLMIAAT